MLTRQVMGSRPTVDEVTSTRGHADGHLSGCPPAKRWDRSFGDTCISRSANWERPNVNQLPHAEWISEMIGWEAD